MNYKNVLLCFIGTSAYFIAGVFAREAIVGGHVADLPSFSYHVSILSDGHVPRCGGGIINNDTVITGARCVIEANGELAGKHISIVAKTSELGVGLIVGVEKIYIPIEFLPGLPNTVGDIAVLKLKKQLNLEEQKITQLTTAKDMDIDNRTAIISGFGWNNIDSNRLVTHTDHRLRYARADILDGIECLHNHPGIQNTVKRFCARVKQIADRSGACNGDFGGPLVYRGKVIIGVLSIIANDCAERRSSGIYTRVSHYRSFIGNAMKNTWTKNLRIIDV